MIMSVNAESLIELTGIKELLKNSYSTIMRCLTIRPSMSFCPLQLSYFREYFFVKLKVHDRFGAVMENQILLCFTQIDHRNAYETFLMILIYCSHPMK